MIRPIMRALLVLLYAAAGYFHLATPDTFTGIMPGRVPFPAEVVFWSGIAELAGAAALAQPFNPSLRQAGAAGLALYALCVWPANINHMLIDLAKADGGFGLAYHIPRLAFQPVLIWAPLWASGMIRWPFAKSAS